MIRSVAVIIRKDWSTMVLAIIASIGLFLLRLQGCDSEIWLCFDFLFIVSFAIAVHVLNGVNRPVVPMWLRFYEYSMTVQYLIGATVIATPLISNLAQTILGARGEATELVWLAMLQNAAIWQAAIARTQKQEWTSFLLSCFLMLFGVATSDRNGMLIIVVPFGLFAAWWLMARYWKTIERGFVAVESVPLIRLRMLMVLLLCFFTALVGGIAALGGKSIASLNGFMPTSGGNRDADPSAKKGVGNGDMLVAAKEEAFTFGPVDSDLFLDSDAPSMYDIANDMFGAPKDRVKQINKAIALSMQSKEAEQEGTESKKAGREFSVMRQPTGRNSATRPDQTGSQAAFHLIGKVPQHLRMEAFNTFDGVEWTRSTSLDVPQSDAVKMSNIYGKPWVTLKDRKSEITYPVRERLTTKLINIKSERIASPSLLSNAHIDRVDREDFFELTGDGQLIMPGREFIPQLTVVHQLFQIPQLHALRESSNHLSRIAKPEWIRKPGLEELVKPDPLACYMQSPIDFKSLETWSSAIIRQQTKTEISSLTDWQKVEAIVEHLRSFEVDTNFLPNQDSEDVISYVLKNERGPDYLLATTAAMLIRGQGIPCRFINGFYASPKRYLARAGLTEVLQQDLHSWVEVYAHGLWIPVEPSAGYAIPRDYRSWTQWAIQCWWGCRDYAIRNPILILFCCLLIGVAIAARCRLLDASCSAVFVITQFFPTTTRIRLCLMLLRIRLWTWNVLKPAHATVRKWLDAQLGCDAKLSERDRNLVIEAVQRMAYGAKDSTNSWIHANRIELGRIHRVIIQRGIRELFQSGPVGSQWNSNDMMKITPSP